MVSKEDRQEELIAAQTEVDKVRALDRVTWISTENSPVWVFLLEGKPGPSTQLSLRLEDFAPDRVSKPSTLRDKRVLLSKRPP